MKPIRRDQIYIIWPDGVGIYLFST